ncbi:hypothetical protein [Chromobacterium sp. ASV23]|uniref:hypothetical protein n=1 Tax=Chromobacterium sp. ASV23 TaxID=2795110 RepID=UPI0018EB36CB|nr:hypothetical protein [Chromobacterium sp. ASV23]
MKPIFSQPRRIAMGVVMPGFTALQQLEKGSADVQCLVSMGMILKLRDKMEKYRIPVPAKCAAAHQMMSECYEAMRSGERPVVYLDEVRKVRTWLQKMVNALAQCRPERIQEMLEHLSVDLRIEIEMREAA